MMMIVKYNDIMGVFLMNYFHRYHWKIYCSEHFSPLFNFAKERQKNQKDIQNNKAKTKRRCYKINEKRQKYKPQYSKHNI